MPLYREDFPDFFWKGETGKSRLPEEGAQTGWVMIYEPPSVGFLSASR